MVRLFRPHQMGSCSGSTSLQTYLCVPEEMRCFWRQEGPATGCFMLEDSRAGGDEESQAWELGLGSGSVGQMILKGSAQRWAWISDFSKGHMRTCCPPLPGIQAPPYSVSPLCSSGLLITWSAHPTLWPWPTSPNSFQQNPIT